MNRKTEPVPENPLEEITELALSELYTWVLWQFPHQKTARFCAAAHAPEAGKEWIPALIDPERQVVSLFTAVPKKFTTPETAADWIRKQKLTG